MNFYDLGLSDQLYKAVEDAGYTTPTPIQQKSIPHILMGRDIMGVAQTGTGKTASFTLPMIDILAEGRARARMPRALVLAPTRELAAQVEQNFTKYSKYHPQLNTVLIVGGSNMADQMKLLDRGVQVLIATPGRLIDLFERGQVLLTGVDMLVIDECDRMLDMGFIPDVQKIVNLLPTKRQTLMFSATMNDEIRALSAQFLNDPREVAVDPPSSTATTVDQFLIVVEEINKRRVLRDLLKTDTVKNAIVFCNRKTGVATLTASLKRHGFSVGSLHGDMEQDERFTTLDGFKAGNISILVCSDVAARGLDIADLSHVFNFDVPFSPEDYVHRIGRTGRAGKTGRTFMLATPGDGLLVQSIVTLVGKEFNIIQPDGLPQLELITDKALLKAQRGAARGGNSRNKKPHSDSARAPAKQNEKRVPRARSGNQQPSGAYIPPQPQLETALPFIPPQPLPPMPMAPAKQSHSTQSAFGSGDDIPAFMRKSSKT